MYLVSAGRPQYGTRYVRTIWVYIQNKRKKHLVPASASLPIAGSGPHVRSFFLFERSEFLIATSPPKNLRVFDYVAAAVLAADADAAVLVATMTPPYVRQKRLLAG